MQKHFLCIRSANCAGKEEEKRGLGVRRGGRRKREKEEFNVRHVLMLLLCSDCHADPKKFAVEDD